MRWLRYVPHAEVETYLAKGWLIEDDLKKSHHGAHAVIVAATNEAWLPVVGWEGLYEVSLRGEVRSLDRVMTSPTGRRGYPRKMIGRILKPGSNGRYLTVNLHGADGARLTVYVAHIVAAGMRCILIEREEEYQADIARRMELAQQPTKRAAVAKTKNQLDDPNSLPLFALEGAA
jgi:hypothetical protein